MVLGDNAFEGTSVGTLILERDFSGTAFANNAGLTSLTMRGDISGIPDGAFTNCTGLKSYTVESESLSSIGAGHSKIAQDLPRLSFRQQSETLATMRLRE